MSDCIIVMSRYPVPGLAKTRLIPAIGAMRAAALHERMVRHTLNTVDEFRRSRSVDACVCYTGGTAEQMRERFGSHFRYEKQSEGDLGHRMHRAIIQAIQSGATRVVVIGTDCPSLNTSFIELAFDRLMDADLVWGPARDGGYYLLGCRRVHEVIFNDIHWGTAGVLSQSIRSAESAGLISARLPALSDVDFAEDLVSCRRLFVDASDVFPPCIQDRLSVIIPTLNEESCLPRTLKQFSSLPDDSSLEVIVADGGSCDKTISIAESFGARVVSCNSGRGPQLNSGACISTGEWLLFLHADTLLPPDYRSQIEQLLAEVPSVNPADRQSQRFIRAGAFRLRIDAEGWIYRIIEAGANLRSRWRQMPYGDQAFFIRSGDFFDVGGFQNWPLMEDFEFSQRIRRCGRFALASGSVRTSARRWQKKGVVRTTIRNQLTALAFRLGASPEFLADRYRR
ncbi:MAG: TIGR04283 family arsenosugar biosynthesis glycosyltransferase [Planctomycetaceae bacterium]|nr:TIGR04283 family arsenosugar biosynthesis glycosyltransferase [Planctomycetaceae bacterium]